MRKKIAAFPLIVLSLLMVNSMVATAQNTRGPSDEDIIYKWSDNGLVHYAKVPPKDRPDCLAERADFEGDCIKLNKFGLEIKDIDYGSEFTVIQPMTQIVEKDLEVDASANGKSDMAQASQRLEQQSLSEARQRKKNCDIAQENMRIIKENKEVYEQDPQTGNLVRLNAEQIQSKEKQAQKDIDYYCSP